MKDWTFFKWPCSSAILTLAIASATVFSWSKLSSIPTGLERICKTQFQQTSTGLLSVWLPGRRGRCWNGIDSWRIVTLISAITIIIADANTNAGANRTTSKCSRARSDNRSAASARDSTESRYDKRSCQPSHSAARNRAKKRSDSAACIGADQAADNRTQDRIAASQPARVNKTHRIIMDVGIGINIAPTKANRIFGDESADVGIVYARAVLVEVGVTVNQ
jgi:hypothetical protein